MSSHYATPQPATCGAKRLITRPTLPLGFTTFPHDVAPITQLRGAQCVMRYQRTIDEFRRATLNRDQASAAISYLSAQEKDLKAIRSWLG